MTKGIDAAPTNSGSWWSTPAERKLVEEMRTKLAKAKQEEMAKGRKPETKS